MLHRNGLKVSNVLFFVFITTALVAGGFFAPQMALAVGGATVTPASGGTNISIDTTSAGPTPVFKTLSGPTIMETTSGDIAGGDHTITLPEGWEFDTSSTVTVLRIVGNIEPDSQTVTPGTTSFTFTISNPSTEASGLAFVISSMKVRPTGTTLSTGSMTYSGAGIVGVNGSTNFGTLSTVAGAVTKLAFTTQPGDAVYGSLLSTQPVVVTQDQFGNDSTNGLIETEMVSLSLTGGTGALEGTVSLDIGMGGSTPGTVIFTDLTVDTVGTGKILIASADSGFTINESDPFNITPKPLTATVTVNDKDYDGNNSANITGVVLDGIVDGDVVTTNFSGAMATFEDENALTGKTVSATGINLPSEEDALVFEYAKVDPATCDNAPYPLGDTNTFNTKGVVEGGAYAWLSSGPSGTCGNGTFDANHMSLTDWKSTGTAGIDGTTEVLRIEIEIDNWILQSGADISNILINGTLYGEGQVTLSTTDGATAEWVGGVARLETTGDVNTGREARIVIQASDIVDIATLNDLDTISWDVAGITGYLPHADVIVNTGNYSYDGTAVGTADITPLDITVTPVADQTKIYGDADLVFAYTSDPDLIGDDTFTGALSRVAGEDVNTYAYEIGSLSASPNYLLTLVPGTFAITQRPITVEATASSKVYDGNTTSVGIPTITEGTLAVGDSANFIQVYSTTDVNTGKKLTPSGTAGGNNGNNYIYTFDFKMNGTIIEKELTITGLSAGDKTYDGTTDAVVSGISVLEGKVGSDNVTLAGIAVGEFNTANAGVNTVPVSGLSLVGDDVSNYTLTQPVLEAEILRLEITGSFTANNKVYDGNTTAAVLTQSPNGVLPIDGGNVILTGGTASFTTRNVGEDIMVTASGMVLSGSASSNYNLTSVDTTTADITVKSINVFAKPDTKIYDGTTNSSVAPTVAVEDLKDGDTVGTAPTQEFDTKDATTGKTLTPSGLIVNDGNGGNNYLPNYVNNETGEIEKKNLTVIGAISVSKTYNGEINDAVVDFTTGPATLSGVISGEEALVSLVSTGYSATYVDKNVATGKQVTVSGLTLAGTGANNYSLTQLILNDGVITPATLTVTATGVNKTYNTNTTATVTLGDNRVPSDNLTFEYTANFSDKNVDPNKPVSVTGIAIIGGADADNYILGNDTTTTEANITQATLIATITVDDKIYDGTDVATITDYAHDALGDDDVVLSGGTATFEDANVDENKDVDAVGITLTGVDALNYSYDGTAMGEADITPLGITGSFTAGNKVYDGNKTATIITRSPDGVLPRDDGDVALVGGTAEFADANVNDDIVVTEIVAMTLTGSAAGNYELTGVDTAIANITKAPLNILAVTMSREYGDANPTLAADYDGFVEGENESVLDTPVVLSTTADETSPVGNYDITALGALDNNYEITHENGILTVFPAPIEIELDEDQGKIYGESDEVITYTATGFKNGQNESIFIGELGRAPGENAGDYLIDLGTLDVGDNYFVVDSFFDVDYVIEPRPLTVSAVSDTKEYDGDTTSLVTPEITEGELQFGQTSDFTQTYNTPDAGSGRILTADGIVDDGNGGSNYSYNFSNTAVGEITKAPLTITADDKNKEYGDVNPTLTATYDGFVNDETESVLDTQVTLETTANEASTVGDYPITASGAASNNYEITHVDGTLTVDLASITITPDSEQGKIYGESDEVITYTATGFKNGQNESIFIGELGRAPGENAGDYLIDLGTLDVGDNYFVVDSFFDVDYTIERRSLTVVADDQGKVYGDTFTFSGTEFTTSELVDGDTVTSVTLTSDGSPAEALADDYDIVPSVAIGSGLSNYDIDYVKGTLIVTDTVAPTVVSHTPSFNALNISPTTAIVITFSEAVDVESGDIFFSPEISGFIITNSGTSVVTVTPNAQLDDNTTYTVTLNGVEDLNDNSLPIYGDIKFTTATNYSIDLNANASGWNLISLPVVPSNTAIAAVLGSAADDIDAVWTYDPTNPNAVDGWLVFVPGNPEGTNNLTLMTTGFGYWVSVTGNANLSGSGTLLIAGPTLPPSRSLQSGWNLIGYYQLPDEDDSTPENAFVSIGASGVGYNGLWGFNNTTGFFNSVTTINPGDAFWISLPNAKDYTPSNIFEE